MIDKKNSLRMRHTIDRYQPSAFLLLAQLLQLILYAVFDGLRSQRVILNVLGALVLILVLWVVSRNPVLQWIAWALAIPAFVMMVLSTVSDNPNLLAWSALLEGALYFYAVGSLIAYMLGDRRVTTDELFAAGVTFTLLAWGFAYLYFVCQEWVPGSFINGAHPGEPLTFIELLFLSFTNLSATGLGDVLPVSAWARVLAILEQFSGVGYITFVVSRLISLTLANRERRHH